MIAKSEIYKVVCDVCGLQSQLIQGSEELEMFLEERAYKVAEGKVLCESCRNIAHKSLIFFTPLFISTN